MANGQRLLPILDRIVHTSISGIDLEQSVAGLRRLCNGDAPSTLLTAQPNSGAALDDLQRQLQTTNLELTMTRRELAQLKRKQTKPEDEWWPKLQRIARNVDRISTAELFAKLKVEKSTPNAHRLSKLMQQLKFKPSENVHTDRGRCRGYIRVALVER